MTNDKFFNISCSGCGAPMKLIDKYKFHCEYCQKDTYVYPDSKVNIVVNRKIEDSSFSRILSEEQTNHVKERIYMDMALQLGAYLLEHNYVKIEEYPSLEDKDKTVYSIYAKVVNEDEDE